MASVRKEPNVAKKSKRVSLKLSDSELEKLYPALDEVVEAVEKIAGNKAKEKHRDHRIRSTNTVRG